MIAMKSPSTLRYTLLGGLGVLGVFGLFAYLQPPTTPARSEPVRVAQTEKSRNEKTKAASSKAPETDGTQRQTASVWTGSPLGPDGAFEDPNREYTLRLPEVFDALGIKQGSKVADIGAGGGWLSVRLSKRVGDSGTVYAQEILKKYTDYIEKRAQKAKIKNIKTILGTPTDPKLPQNSLDAVIILNAYHEFELPLLMLRRIQAAMKPGARLGFIERDTDELRREARKAYEKTGKIKRRVTESRDKDPKTDDHRLAADIVEREAAAVGFKKVALVELRDYHYLLVVEKPKK